MPHHALLTAADRLIAGAGGDLPRAARDLVDDASSREGGDGTAALLALANHLETRALGLARLATARRSRDAESLDRILELVDALRDRGLPCIGEEPPDILSETDRDWDILQAMAPDCYPRADPDGTFRAGLDEALALRLIQRSADPPLAISPGLVLHALGDLRADLLARGRTHLLAPLASAKARVWKGLLRHGRLLMELDGSQGAFLDRLSDELQDRAEDVMARSEELASGEAAHILLAVRRDLQRLLILRRALQCSGAARGVRRMIRRLEGARQDRRVRDRQRAILGDRLLPRFDRLVLVLVASVIAILGIDLFADLDSGQRLALAWADACICALLLAEFTWRFALSGFRPGYVLRYGLFHVLPSIPFGLAMELQADSMRHLGPEMVQVFRSSRLFRLLRGLRVLRIIAFAIQGADRFVRRHAPLFNRNVVIFDPPADREEGLPGLSVRLKKFRERVSSALRSAMAELPEEERKPILTNRFHSMKLRFESAAAVRLVPVAATPGTRDIRVEEFVEELLSVDRASIEMLFTENKARRIASLIRLFDRPFLRSLPLLREAVPGARRMDPYDAIAAAARGVGRFTDRVVERLRFVGDLTGIVTGPQLLDRIGTALVRATQRPATRLLLFGLASLLLSWLIGRPEEGTWLHAVDNFLKRVLGTAFLVLGGACLLVQAFGRWIKRIADSATDLYEKVAEAQGINLLKFRKLEHREEDLTTLYERVLKPELLLRGMPEAAMPEARSRLLGFIPGGPAVRGAPSSPVFETEETIFFHYMDYLDGAILHRSNVKSTEQFLGNLEIDAIRRQRLGVAPRERRRLKRLDLQGERLIPTGPYLWFRFITESLAQRTAKLVIQYNRYAIPLSRIPAASREQIDAMEQWLSDASDDGNPEDPDRQAGGTARFNALHFMSADPSRDAAVEREYGARVLHRLEHDRRHMVRAVFSSYPYEWMPRHRRTVNPFSLYFQWIGQGRIVLLPLRIAWTWTTVWLRAWREFFRVIRDQIRPAHLRRVKVQRISSRDVALRKIHRMHLPVFMAVLDLRTSFDPEYLGVPLPGTPLESEELETVESDLNLIGAREFQREAYRVKKRDQERYHRELEGVLIEEGYPERPLDRIFEGGTASGSPAGREGLRALAVAFAIDYKGCRTLLTAKNRIDAAMEKLLASPPPDAGLGRGGLLRHSSLFRWWLARSPFASRTPSEIALLRRAFASNRHRVRTLAQHLRLAGGAEQARRAGLAVLGQAFLDPSAWSRQIVTLRTIQALVCLDIRNSRRVVLELAGYDRDAAGSSDGLVDSV